MNYAKLNQSLKDITKENLNLNTLFTYIEPQAYNKCATNEYINAEYLKFESWLTSFMAVHPFTKNIQVVNFRIKIVDANFVIEVSTFESYSAKDVTWSQKVLETYQDEVTKSLMSELTPSTENADEAFIISALLITFINEYIKTNKKNLTKDRSILGIYPTLRLAFQYEEAPIYIIKSI